MKRVFGWWILVLVGVFGQAQTPGGPLLLRAPTVNHTHIAFTYANDIWIVDRKGGEARRLTAGDTFYINPHFSPDGSLLAFTAEINGNADVYVMAATGGPLRRLTYHPQRDTVMGWSADGKQVLFESLRNSWAAFNRLYTVTLGSGGIPNELPLPFASDGALSPDGKRVAYIPLTSWQPDWKRYRGGQTRHLWLADLKTLDIESIPRDNSNDFNPMWIGNTVYFLSDRNGPVTLFAYDTQSKKVRQLVENHGYDLKSAAATNDAIVYEQFGEIHLFDLASGKEHRVDIQVHGDLPALRPHFEKVDARRLQNFALSPTGVRAAFEAHGEIITVPADKGDVRNLTNTTGVAERDPAWSPDGKWIAYFSDATGDYALEIRNQSGLGEPKRIPLPPSYYYLPKWSPDSKKITFTDKKSIVWYADVEKGTVRKVDQNPYQERDMQPSWSPDSKWICYVKHLRNHLHAINVYSLDQDKWFQVTDGMSDARFPAFDAGGKYLYFTASTDMGLVVGFGDMSGVDRPTTRSVYIAVLDKSLPSPLPFESDEEKVADEKPAAPDAKPAPDAAPAGDSMAERMQAAMARAAAAKKPVSVKIDLDNIDQRILALPIPARNYGGLWAGKEGVIFVGELPPLLNRPLIGYGGPLGPQTISRYNLTRRKLDKLFDNVAHFTVSANGDKVLYHLGVNWIVAPAMDPARPGEGMLKMTDIQIPVDPRAEWAQMYHETWRIERDFFYAPNFHGLDIVAAEKKYAAFLPGLSTRDDLYYLQREMLNEMSVGHMYVTEPREPNDGPRNGLLGADYVIENGRYRFAHVYNGENWNPQARAPLTQPGINVTAGEYLLAVDGRELHATDNLFSFFEGTASKAVLLRVGPDPSGKNSREVTVVPAGAEINLRNLAWIEGNRRKVNELSGGKLAYVYMPNTLGPGYTSFNRMYFSQIDKEGLVLDGRNNGGGLLSDYVMDNLRRIKTDCMTTREGDDVCHPAAGIFGPKVMLTNEMAGSGGDALPWYFKKLHIGPLIGKTTWGGLVGIGDFPELIDGGTVTAPRNALYGLEGEWEVEGHGVAPDIEVELDPKALRDGHDLQLERAVKIAMEELAKHPLPKYKRPPYPDYHQQITKTAAAGQ